MITLVFGFARGIGCRKFRVGDLVKRSVFERAESGLIAPPGRRPGWLRVLAIGKKPLRGALKGSGIRPGDRHTWPTVRQRFLMQNARNAPSWQVSPGSPLSGFHLVAPEGLVRLVIGVGAADADILS